MVVLVARDSFGVGLLGRSCLGGQVLIFKMELLWTEDLTLDEIWSWFGLTAILETIYFSSFKC